MAEKIELEIVTPKGRALAEIQPKLEKVLSAPELTAEVESEKKSLIDQENWLAVQLELYGDPPPPTMRPFEEWGPPASPLLEEETGAHSTELPTGSP